MIMTVTAVTRWAPKIRLRIARARCGGADRPNFARTVRPPEEIAHHDRQLAILLLPHIKKLAFHRNCGLAVSA